MPPKKVTPKGRAATPPKAEASTPAKKTTAKKRAPAAKKSATADRKWVRNIRYVQCRVTLMDDHRIELKPRGQRGDLSPISEDQQDDPILQENVGMIFEVIDDAEARQILAAQSTNQQVGPTAFDYLVNEYGQKLVAARTTTPFEQQGFTVAQRQDAPNGRNTEQNEQLVRGAQGAAPQQVNVPGSPGTIPQVPSDIPADQVADWVARNAPVGENSNAGDILRSQLLGGGSAFDPVQRT